VPVEPTFSQGFLRYGLCVGVLALVDFLADVLRFVDWRIFGSLAVATDALLGVVFLPAWILCLAQQLAAATERFEREGAEATATAPSSSSSSREGELEMASLKAEAREIS